MNHSSRVACIAFALSASSIAYAQGVLHEVHGTGDAECLGSTVAFVGDIDADGVEDFAAAGPRADFVGFDAGRAILYSGATGAVLYVRDGTVVDSLFGSAIAGLGDLNGDGHGDFAIGAPWQPTLGPKTGRVWVYSGIDGAVLYELEGFNPIDEYGGEIEPLGDVTGDGIPDFAVGALRAQDLVFGNVGAVYVHSGVDGALVTARFGNVVQANYGRSIAGVGDVDGDGFVEFGIGVSHHQVAGNSAGKFEMHTLAQTAPVWTVIGTNAMHTLGTAAAAIGDANQDGLPDVVVGADSADNQNLGSTGLALILSGGTGAVIRSIYGTTPNDRLGSSVGAAGDLDDDGRADVLVGLVGGDVLASNGGAVRAVSSATGATLAQIDGTWKDGNLGNDLAGGRDLNGDGVMDVVIGAPFTAKNIFKGGSVYVESLACGQASSHGVSCPGWLGFQPVLNASGCFTPLGTLTISLTAGLGGSVCVLFLSGAPAAIPLPGGCALNVALPIAFTATIPLAGFGPGTGSFSATATTPLGVSSGSVVLQAFVIDANAPSGYSSTKGVTIQFE